MAQKGIMDDKKIIKLSHHVSPIPVTSDVLISFIWDLCGVFFEMHLSMFNSKSFNELMKALKERLLLAGYMEEDALLVINQFKQNFSILLKDADNKIDTGANLKSE